MNLVWRIAAAAVVGVVAYLVCVFVGGLLATVGLPPAEFIGHFLERFAWAIAVVVALWFFFFGGRGTSWPGPPA